jgi:hypothetical protein
MANGLVDTSTLTRLPAQPHLRLSAAAAAAWVALDAANYAAFGWHIIATDAYRDYATQERIFRQRFTTAYLSGRPRKWWLGRWWYLKRGYAMAATPGTSNHGLGITVDVANLGGFGGTRYRQFASIAEPRGWSNAEGRSINEAWHWNYRGSASTVTNPIWGGGPVPGVTVTPPAPIEEPDLDDNQARQLAQTTEAVGRLETQIKSIVTVLSRIDPGVAELMRESDTHSTQLTQTVSALQRVEDRQKSGGTTR